MDASADTAPSRLQGMGKVEFISLMAMLMAVNSMAIDVMLPALQQIGAALGISSENHRQYVISAYLLGFSVAQLFFGPLSDRFGRKVPIFCGLIIYIASAMACVFVPSFGALLFFRALQGIGSAATRVIAISIVRDVYGGRQMAEAMSLIMMVFMIVPVIAPGTGQVVMLFGDWRLIFIFMALMATSVAIWMYLRLPETMDPADRRPFTIVSVARAFKIVLTNRVAFCYALASAFIFGAMFGFINSAQQIYVEIYHLGVWFPLAFSVVAITMSFSSFMNSRFVGRFGMRRLSHGALLAFMAINGVWLLLTLFGPQPTPFVLYLVLFSLAMFQFGWIGSNFNSLAMEPLGHVAGTASSVLGFMGTAGGGIIGAVIGQAYNGTTLPLVTGFFVLSLIGLVFVLIAERGKLFQPHNKPI